MKTFNEIKVGDYLGRRSSLVMVTAKTAHTLTVRAVEYKNGQWVLLGIPMRLTEGFKVVGRIGYYSPVENPQQFLQEIMAASEKAKAEEQQRQERWDKRLEAVKAANPTLTVCEVCEIGPSMTKFVDSKGRKALLFFTPIDEDYDWLTQKVRHCVKLDNLTLWSPRWNEDGSYNIATTGSIRGNTLEDALYEAIAGHGWE